MANNHADDSLSSRIIKRENWYTSDPFYDENMFSSDSMFLQTGAIDNSVEKVNYTSTNEISNRVRNELCDDVIDAASTNQNYRHLSQYPQSCNTSFYNSQSYLGYHQMSANNDDCHSNITFTAECVHISNNNDNNTTTNTNDYYYHNLHRCETDDQHMISQKKTQIVVPVVKRRNTANKKERRRTQSINNAFSELRDCIPNVPTDTKLSKIKTLRLATSYISYLLEVLNSNDPVLESFKADLSSHANKKAHSTYYSQIKFSQIQHKMNKINPEDVHSLPTCREENIKKSKGRTGWPQDVWALKFKQEPQL